MTEEELEAAAERGEGTSGGSGKEAKEEAKGADESKDGREEVKAGEKERGGDGGGGVDRATAGLEQFSTSGRKELDREDSAGGV